MKVNNDQLLGTYAVTFVNSLLMTYLAVVVFTCVCTVQMFKHGGEARCLADTCAH